MTMTPGLRKFALTAHVTTTVGWLGAVVVFLALAVVGLTSEDARTVRGAYLVMEPAAWFVLVPLALASLLTGLVVSLGTAWGLFRHYWVLAKLVITIFATIVLLIYMNTFRFMAAVAADPSADLGAVRNASPGLHAALALLLLLVATVLGIYKPPGMTPYGRRKQHEQRTASQPIPPRLTTARNRADTHTADLPSDPDPHDDIGVGRDRGSTTGTAWALYVPLGIIGLIVLAVVVVHLTGSALTGH
jgi:uncharacterized membrane protein